MTLLSGFHDTRVTVTDPTTDDFIDGVRRYVSTDLFRSAQFEELVLDDNPYRRPVRPEDLEWLRFNEPLTVNTAARLSALLGHRMLLSIYDSRRCLLPRSLDESRWRDLQTFYDPDVIEQGEHIRPGLEHHAFTYAEEAAAPAAEETAAGGVSGVNALLARVSSSLHERSTDLKKFRDAAVHKDRIDRTIAIQLIGHRLSAPLRLTTTMLEEFGVPTSVAPSESFTAGMSVGHATRVDSLLRLFTDHHSLGWAPHNYFQFYLPTTLGLMNYIGMRLGRSADPFALIGAMATRTLATDSLLSCGSLGVGGHQPDLDHTLGWLGTLVEETLHGRYGPWALRRFAAGVLEFDALLEAHHLDLITQLRWIDADQFYAKKAMRLQRAITANHIEVELDTFVETSDECSTAHVHDDVRLVVIESGTMEFWNCYGEIHTFNPGDAMYVPQHRLHGSVVTSGTCVYHQPVITPDIDRVFG